MRSTGVVCILIYTILLMHSCTNIAPNDSVTWDVNYIVPLLKEKITVSMLELRAKNIVDDSARSGDTIFISQKVELYQQCKTDIFTMPELSNDWHKGDLVIRKLNLETLTSKNHHTNSALLMKRFVDQADQKIFWRDTVVVKQIEKIEFGHTSEVLRAVVKNQSQLTSVKDISYSLISSTDTLVFKTIEDLGPQESITIETGLDGFVVSDTIVIECSYVTDSPNHITDVPLSFSTTFDGLHFKKAIINDSLLACSFNYELDVPFGQAGFNASYIDISSLSLPFKINNSLPVGLKVNCRIDAMWEIEYCNEHAIQAAEDIGKHKLDTAYFKGNKIKDVYVTQNRTNGSDDISDYTIQINNTRILPSWSSNDTINSLHMTIHADFVVQGKMITVENVERTGIQIGTPSLNIKAINGYYISEKRFDNPSEIIPIMSQSSTSDIVKSFRNRLVPDRTNLDVNLKFMFPDNTRFESVDLLCRLFERDSSDVLDSLVFTMENITAGKTYSHQVSFNRIVERLPDSLRYSLTYIIKPKKNIFLDNDVIYRNDNSYSAVFDAQAKMAMTMYFVWGILDTVRLELDRNAALFPIPSQNIALMKSKELELSVLIHNNSNITGRLRAVQTNGQSEHDGDSVYLLGKSGLILPERGHSKECTISFNEQDVRSLTAPDSLIMKWIIELFPCDIDALRDTDYIDIDAELSLRGQHSTSSMFGLR
jgi:hypothetical protein